jgi:hypothetical protein
VTGLGNPLRARLSYANVVATLALFVALGGASYAGVTLPANSVGPRQLQRGAVTPSRLAFPLTVASTTDGRLEDVPQGACNGGPLPPGQPAPPCTPPLLGGPTPGRKAVVHLRFPARLIISVVLGISKRGTPATDAEVSSALGIDDHPVTRARSAITIDGGQTSQMPLQAAVSVPAGTHTIGVYRSADYLGSGPGDVIIGPVSVIVDVLPAS